MAIHVRGVLDDLPPPDEDVWPWLTIYLYISIAGALSSLFYISLGYYASLQASRSLFTSMLQRLSRAPSRFFDITPIGRILNRFTSDINTVDYNLQGSARSALSASPHHTPPCPVTYSSLTAHVRTLRVYHRTALLSVNTLVQYPMLVERMRSERTDDALFL